MKILLRTFALIAGFLSITLVLVFAMAAYFAVTRWLVRDWVATLVFFSAAFLAGRSTVWLWTDSPFWRTKKKRAEVFALGTLLLAWPIVLFAEKHSGDPIRAVVQASAVLAAASAYFITRRLFTEQTMPQQA